MNSQKILIISENDLGRTFPRTVKLLEDKGFEVAFARGPLKIEELLLGTEGYTLIWDLLYANADLSTEIAGIIAPMKINGILFISPNRRVPQALEPKIVFPHMIIESFERPAEVLTHLERLSAQINRPRQSGPSIREHQIPENQSPSVEEKAFIKLLKQKRLPQSTPSADQSHEARKEFEKWDPIDGDTKNAFTKVSYENTPGWLGKIKSLFTDPKR